MQDSSITAALQRLQTGDDAAAQLIWDRYFQKLAGLAAHRLRTIPRRAADEEDVALSAMNSFLQGLQRQRFPNLGNHNELWKLLVTITIRKANAVQRKHHAQKRGGGLIRGESVFVSGDRANEDGPGLAGELDFEPTPALAAVFAENVERLLSQLDQAGLREIALMRMEGYSNEEIAVRVNKSLGTVERKLNLIRKIWRNERNVLG